MAIIHGVKSYLVLGAESTWGVTPGSPVYYHIPVTNYGVRMNRDRRNANPFVGLMQRKHGRSFRGMPSGQLQTNLYGFKPNGNSQSIMEYLITWAMSQPEAIDKLSKFADWAEGPDISNVRHNGLRVNGCTIEGSADSGTVQINLDLMGKSETALVTAQALPDDREGCVEMEFSDCTFALGGSPVPLRSFRWQAPAYLAAGQLVETLSFQMLKESDTYTAYQRAFAEQELTGQIVLKGAHRGTGTGGTNYTVLTVDFNRLAFVAPEDTRTVNTLIEEGLSFDVLKPDSSTAAKTLTFSEAA